MKLIKILLINKTYQIVLGLILAITLSSFSLGIVILFFLMLLSLYIGRGKVIFLILSIVVGTLYLQLVSLTINKDINRLQSKSSILQGSIIEDPVMKTSTQEITILPINSNFYIQGEVSKTLEVYRGDEIILKAAIKLPEQSKSFDRIQYLKSKKVILEFDNAEIIKVNRNTWALDTILTKIKNQLSLILETNLPLTQATLSKGLILGDDSNFNDEFKENLKSSGLSHITSVSGYNVGIIYAAILLLNKLINRKLCLVIASIFIILFWQIVGTNNLPTERATIMILLLTACLLLGRKVSYFYLILLSTLIMILEYPYYIYNVSFQLSLGALIGILLIAPKLIKILDKKGLKNIVTEIIAVTISVLIVTIPISYLTFGQISSVSIISNILVLPIIPILTFIIIFTLIFQILNIAIIPTVLFLIINYLAKFIILVVNAMGTLSFSNIYNPKIATIFFAVMAIPSLFLILRNKNVQ